LFTCSLGENGMEILQKETWVDVLFISSLNNTIKFSHKIISILF
jgi:hypothetical protein